MLLLFVGTLAFFMMCVYISFKMYIWSFVPVSLFISEKFSHSICYFLCLKLHEWSIELFLISLTFFFLFLNKTHYFFRYNYFFLVFINIMLSFLFYICLYSIIYWLVWGLFWMLIEQIFFFFLLFFLVCNYRYLKTEAVTFDFLTICFLFSSILGSWNLSSYVIAR